MNRSRLLLLSLIPLGCATARSAVVDDPAPVLCPSYSGFSSVGTVWDYVFAIPFLEGWERSQLTVLDTTTGEAQVETSGVRDGGAFTYTYERTDEYQCSEAGLDLIGWTSTWIVDNFVDSFGDTTTGSWDPGIRILLSDAEMEEPDADWTTSAMGEEVNSAGDTFTIDDSWEFQRRDADTLSILGTSVDTIPVTYGDLRTPWIWYAADIGVVKRSGLTLDSYSLGSGALMK